MDPSEMVRDIVGFVAPVAVINPPIRTAPASTTPLTETVCGYNVNIGVLEPATFNLPSLFVLPPPPQLPLSSSSHHEARNVETASNPVLSLLTPSPPLQPSVPSSSSPASHREVRDEETATTPAWRVRYATPPGETREEQKKRLKRKRSAEAYYRRLAIRNPPTSHPATLQPLVASASASSSSLHQEMCNADISRYASPLKETSVAQKKRLTWRHQALYYYGRL
ncbi:hypothetical protein ZHAS_00002454 [Anopheles sinensis]|uniref:Uncharacterized protein n=1 Tax=Anopheles sinensis TaxID=74873 RepID=A0A084VCA8_ANOSI|nr:hypothetical protein ZHAS_00002454 [Anopheles sinensis]